MNNTIHKAALTLGRAVMLTAALCMFVNFAPQSLAADDEAVIDGYELPDMFDEDTSTPIQDHTISNTPKEKYIAPHKASPMPAPAANYESAFKPVENIPTVTTAKTPTPVPELKQVDIMRPLKRPYKASPQPVKADEAIIALSTQTMAALQSIPKPFKRSPRIKNKATPAALVKSPNSPVMPAVPAGSVEVVTLSQPDMAPEPLNDNDVTFISVEMDIDTPPKEDEGVFDVSDYTAPTEQPQQETSEAIPSNEDLPTITYLFDQGDVKLNDDMKGLLNKDVIQTLTAYPDLRIEIRSYADAVDDSPSSARRASLARALAVRDHLLNNGIESQRMDLRALGSETNKLPIDRIEISLLP